MWGRSPGLLRDRVQIWQCSSRWALSRSGTQTGPGPARSGDACQIRPKVLVDSGVHPSGGVFCERSDTPRREEALAATHAQLASRVSLRGCAERKTSSVWADYRMVSQCASAVGFCRVVCYRLQALLLQSFVRHCRHRRTLFALMCSALWAHWNSCSPSRLHRSAGCESAPLGPHLGGPKEFAHTIHDSSCCSPIHLGHPFCIFGLKVGSGHKNTAPLKGTQEEGAPRLWLAVPTTRTFSFATILSRLNSCRALF